jgi:hypothetical protein
MGSSDQSGACDDKLHQRIDWDCFHSAQVSPSKFSQFLGTCQPCNEVEFGQEQEQEW